MQFSRQSGKTTALVHTVETLLIYFRSVCGTPIRVCIFAPQKEQAKTDFDRLKDALETESVKSGHSLSFPESNANTINVYENGNNNGWCYIMAITKTSNIESKTSDLNIYEEAQLIDDKLRENKADPMVASTNGAKVFIGTEGYKMCYFLKLVDERLQGGGKIVRADCHQIIKEKRELFNITGDENHLNYEKFILAEKEKGEHRQSFKTQYLLERVLEVGSFITRARLASCYADIPFTWQNKTQPHVVGIDLAKSVDKTVVAVGRVNIQRTAGLDGMVVKHFLEFACAMELRGDDYISQVQMIKDFLDQFKVEGLAIDSTGVGDPVARMLFEKTRIAPFMPIVFSLKSKDEMYKNWLNLIDSGYFKIPKQDHPTVGEAARNILKTLEQEVIELEAERKGHAEQYLSIHHPNKDDAHDDYPDAIALMTMPFIKLFHPNIIQKTNTSRI